MALPACIAAFVCVPRARIALVIAGVSAAALAVFVVGTHGFIAYLTVVLPTHAHAELDNLSQDSLTAILHHLGVADEFALRAGGLQYAAFVGVGIVLAARLYRRDGDAAWPVLVPAAFAMIGGEFIHLSEVAMAIPLAAILAVRIGGIAWIPLVLLALPGESIVNDGRDFLPAALVAALLLRELGVRGPYVIGGSFIVLTGAIVAHAFAMEQVGVISGAIAAPAPGALASLTWEAWNRVSFIGPMWWLEKTLTLVPLLGLAVLTLRFAYPTDRAAAARGSVPVAT